METNTSNQCDTETDDVHSALYLTVDVGACVQQHLDHGLIPTHAGIHERGHPLQREQAEEELQAALLLVSLVYKARLKSFEKNLNHMRAADTGCRVTLSKVNMARVQGWTEKLFFFEPEAFPPT